MLRHLVVAALLIGAAACQKSDAAKGTEAPKGDLEARVARLEKKMDKIVTILQQALPPAETDPAATYSVPIAPEDPVIGPADAKVTVVEGYEFACPYCWRAVPTIDKVLAEYPKDVRVVSKYILIHGAPALPPALAVCAASRQGKYPEMKKLLWARLFNAEGQMQQDQFTAENMEKLAAEAGLDAAKFKTDFAGESCQAWVKKSQEALQPVGTSGTPSFYVNGRHINGAVPFEQFKAIIDEELAKADKAIASGTKPAEYYEQVVVAKGEKKVKGHFDE
jgi:protein-disulfide isomerase